MTEPITPDDIDEFWTELRAYARMLLSLERRAGSIQPTGLLLSALRRQRRKNQTWDQIRWKDRKAFLGSLHIAMRRVLIDHARARVHRPRPATDILPSELRLEDLATAPPQDETDWEQAEVLVVAIERLRDRYPDEMEVAEYKYLSGFTEEEIARILDLSSRTVRERLRRAKLLLHREVLNILNEDA